MLTEVVNDDYQSYEKVGASITDHSPALYGIIRERESCREQASGYFISNLDRRQTASLGIIRPENNPHHRQP